MDAKDSRYSVLDAHDPTRHPNLFRHVPLSVTDPKDRKVLTYDEQRLKNLLPWFLSDHNAASHVGVIGNFLELVPSIRSMIESRQYTFIRVDINIYFTYIKVLLLL